MKNPTLVLWKCIKMARWDPIAMTLTTGSKAWRVSTRLSQSRLHKMKKYLRDLRRCLISIAKNKI